MMKNQEVIRMNAIAAQPLVKKGKDWVLITEDGKEMVIKKPAPPSPPPPAPPKAKSSS
jgi:hypothetical protein